jgi:hypothetical protein
MDNEDKENQAEAKPTFNDARVGQDFQPIIVSDQLWEALKDGADEIPIECTPEEFLILCVVYGVDNLEDIYNHIH